MSILYSIPVHESPECIKQMCDGILFFDNDAVIILHISKSQTLDFFKSHKERIIINPTQFETNWGWDLGKVHISNYQYIKNNFDFNIEYIIFLSSNCLITKNPLEFIKNYDAGFSEYSIETGTKKTPPLLITDKQLGWGGTFLNDFKFLEMLSELKSDKKYGCMIEGCYVKSFIMDKIVYFYSKYFSEVDYLKYINCPEEMIFPTIACNLATKISESLLFYTIGHYGDLNLNEFEQSLKSENTFISKGISRNINNDIREYYNLLINV